ncbi:hypothetical protein BGZ63DRAFT_429499 [Mariannaea sp. PMI_226]|nr:hypothetical protein BGZ63DRAFT_429499 [Mariannaea sp. PMI_226]
MCRMVRRCTTAITISHDKEVYAPVIATELAHQLETWYDCLPASLSFNRRTFDDTFSYDVVEYTSPYPPSGLTAVTRFLQMQYQMCLAGIFWPAVYSVIHVDNISPATLADCSRFFNAYIGFVTSAADAVRCCPQSPWNIYASLFITTMAAFQGVQSLNLRMTIPPAVTRCFTIAAETFEIGPAVDVSPSLRMLKSIMTERLGGLRL